MFDMSEMPASLLDRTLYSYADVDRLVGLRPGTARRWLEGYVRAGRRYEPLLRTTSSVTEAVTWGEMVESRLVAEFRRQAVPVQRLRPAIVRLRDEFGPYPLAHAAPFLEVEGRELVQVIQDEVGLERPLQLVVVRNGQLMLNAATERFRDAVEYEGAAAARLTPIGRTPEVRMDPDHAMGQPAVRNVRAEILAEAYRAGSPREELADLFDLTTDQVDQAIRFELIARSENAA